MKNKKNLLSAVSQRGDLKQIGDLKDSDKMIYNGK